MADKDTPSKKASEDASKEKASLKADSQTKKKNRISGMFNFLKKKDKEDSSDHKGGETGDAQTLAHFADSENGTDSGPSSSTIKNGSDADDKKKKADPKKEDDKKEKKKEKSGHRKIKSSYDGKTRDPLADSEDPEKKKKKEKEKNKTKDKKDKKDKKKDKKDEPESTTEVTQTETEDQDTAAKQPQQDLADLQKQAAEVEDLVAAYQTHETRTQEQKYRTLSRQKSYKEKWGQRTISSKSIRMVQVERKVVYDLFTAPAQNQPAPQTGSAASTPRVEITITKAPTPAQEISVDPPKETAESTTTTESSALKKRALPRRGANKPATKFDMVQKFNQKLNRQAGAEEVEIEAPEPENITIDDKPVARVEEKPVASLAIEPLKLEVTEEVVVLQVTPREHYKETEPDAKPEIKPTTPVVETVKQVEPKKEDVKPVETKPAITVTTPAAQTKPATTTATPATSSPLDQFFQAGESRKEKDRIEQEQRKAQNQKEVLASAKKWDRERDNQETAKLYKVAVKKAQEQVHRIRLMHCKGKRRVWVREVEVSAKSLNEGDAFVLDLDKVIYVWNGAKANAVEKSKAVGIATMIRDHERASHATIVTVDKFAKDEDQDAFWKALGGKPETLASREDGGDDEQYEKDMMEHAKLYKVEVEDNGQTRLEVVLQPEKKLLMDMLVDSEIYVLDCGNEVYGWYGRDCSETKRDALKGETKKLFKQETRAPWAQMFMVGQGGEPFLFRERFADWPDLSHQSAIKKMFRQHESLNVKKVYSNKFNVETMLLNLRPEDDVPCPDGEGTLKVWMVKDKRTKIEVPEEEFGHFYSGQCYIILYEYKKSNALRYIIWTWQGKDSNKLEQGYAVKFTEDLYRHYSRTLFIVQQMIFQNKETLQFLLAFQGLYIVYRGHKGDALDKVAMYHLRGTDILPIHAIQTKTVSASRLNSRDAFVVRNTDSKIQYVWYSKALGMDMDKIGWIDELANNMNEFDETRGIEIKLVVKILEGEEPAEFWEAVGGKKPYADDAFLSSPLLKMHLFHCTAAKTANAVFSANEIYEFYQEDLLSKDIFILDAYFELFVWVGSKSTEMKKRSALEIAAEYLSLLKERENRGIEMNTSVIEEGKEPLRFKALFHDWEDPTVAVPVEAAAQNGSAQTTANTESAAEQKPAAGVTETLQVFYQKYPYEVLKTNAPKECDRSQLEVHLTDEEFDKVFGMTRADFAKVPKWKQLLEKKKLGLF